MDARIKLPVWAADAQRLRQEGKTVLQIVGILKELYKTDLSESRVSQLTSSEWFHNIVKEQLKGSARTDERHRARLEGRKPDYSKAQARAIHDYNVEHGLLGRLGRPSIIEKEEAMLAKNRFEAVSSPDPTDVYHRVRIRCCHNGCSETETFKKRGIISPDAAQKWFIQKGWMVGSSQRADLCPQHAKGVRMEKPVREMEVVEVGLVPATKAAMKSSTAANSPLPHVPVEGTVIRTIGVSRPAYANLSQQKSEVSHEPDPVEERVLGKVERRIIFTKIDEVYDTDLEGYKETWTDLKVANDLGVPVGWVEEIRDENFGPAINEEERLRIEAMEIENFRNSLVEEAKAIIAATKDRDEAAKMVKAAKQSVDDHVQLIDDKIDKFDVALEKFRTLDEETVNLLKLFNERLTVFNYKAGVK